MNMRVGVLQLDEMRLGYEYSEGQGIPIVFLGGTTSTTATWKPVLELLQTDRPVYLVDHRGHGRSSRVANGDYGKFVGQVSDTRQFLENVSGPSTLVGHSQGGIQAFYTAGTSPDLVTDLYLEDITPHFVANSRHVVSPFIAALKSVGGELEKALAAHEKGPEMAARIAAISLGEGVTFGDVRSDESLQIMSDGVLQMDPMIFKTFFEADSVPAFDFDETIRGVRCPIHVARGVPELGGLVLESELDDLRAKGCKVTSTLIEGVGHSVHTDAVDRFVSDLGRFLKSGG
jgi:pimeloyl-ACP methyl ester carboxylesterase